MSYLEPDQLREAALRILGAGLSVLPIDPGTKRPYVAKRDETKKIIPPGGYGWKAQQTVLPTVWEVDQFLKRFPGCWLGIACGDASGGLEDLDFDVPHKAFLPDELKVAPAYDAWREMVLKAPYGAELLDRLTIARTPSNGRHVLYRCPSAAGNAKLARRLTTDAERAEMLEKKGKAQDTYDLVETRGPGGLIVCSPSPGYVLEQGTYESIPTITEDERAWLIGCAKILDRMPQVEKPASKAKGSKAPQGPRSAGLSSGGLTAGSDFDLHGWPWEDILSPFGFQFLGRDYCGKQLVVRPGKDASEGWSGICGPGDIGDRLYCWSTGGLLPAEEPLLKHFVYIKLWHDGDYAKGIPALRKLGFGPQTTDELRTHYLGEPVDSGPNLDEPPFPIGDEPGAEQPALPLDQPSLNDGMMPDYRFTDLGHARRLEWRYGKNLRMCHEWGRFLIWDGSKFETDAPTNPKARRHAHMLVDELSMARGKLKEEGIKCQDGRKINGMLKEFSVLKSISVRVNELDQHPMLLNAPNGVIDLATGELLAHDRGLLLTKSTLVAYDPDAQCPHFEEFLLTVMKGRKPLIGLLLTFLGYALTGSTKEQKFCLMWGPRARNGKGTLFNVLLRILGPDFVGMIEKKLLTSPDSDSTRFARAALEGKRLVYTNETSKKSTLDVEFIKSFVDTGELTIERKGKEAYNVPITQKLFYAVNNLPRVEFDPAYADRVVPIPFEQSFYDRDDDNWKEGDLPRLVGVDERLLEEAPGILALLVKSSVRWKRDGLKIPPEVAAIRAQYRNENDPVALWAAEKCQRMPDAKSRATELFRDYCDFCKLMRLGIPGQHMDFVRRLAADEGIRHVKSQNVSWIRGLQIRPTPLQFPEELELE